MIALLDIPGGNPFEEHPQLRGVWPAELQRIAEEATREALVDMPRGDIGGLYLITKGSQVIGITGFFYVDSVDEPYLRWHGVVPAARGNGYSQLAMQLLVERIKAKRPHAKGLTELVPQNDYGVAVGRHFAKLGFVKSGALETYNWSHHAWQPVRLDIARWH
jgi:RimJ/RimL family protein N-acetyltransferase